MCRIQPKRNIAAVDCQVRVAILTLAHRGAFQSPAGWDPRSIDAAKSPGPFPFCEGMETPL